MNNYNKTLSIIIPTYNMESYLHKCLDSLIVKDKNMHLLEVLVINDGSKDSSSQIAHTYEERYPQSFRVIDKENGNYGSCINRGLKEATGKYIKVLDADDSFDKSSLNDFISFLDSHDADLFITDFQQVHDDGEIVLQNKCPFPSNQVLSLSDYYLTDYFKYLQMHSVTYKRENLIDIGYIQTEGISYTDAQWVFLPISSVKTLLYCPFMLYNYLIGREGQTMAMDVFAKSLPQLMRMTVGRVKMYENYHLANSMYHEYYISKLSETLKYIYRYILVVDNHLIDHLRQFDSEIKNASISFYNYSNDIVLFDKVPFKLIKMWREMGKKEKLPFMYSQLFKMLYAFSNKKH